jgi:hypothetical protein
VIGTNTLAYYERELTARVKVFTIHARLLENEREYSASHPKKKKNLDSLFS